MSAHIEVVCREAAEGWSCSVTVDEGDTRTEHEVSVSMAERDRYAPGAGVEPLVDESFRFLLEREPKESILRRFELSVIERYFPEYPSEIERRLRV